MASFSQWIKAKFKTQIANEKQITLNHRRIFILPTQQGLGLVLLMVLLLLIGYVYTNNLVYMLSFLLASVFFISILHSYKSLAGLVLQQATVNPVFAGENAEFMIQVKNQRNTPRFNLDFAYQDIQQQLIDIDANKTELIRISSKTQQRGWHDLEKINLSCRYPLGIFRPWSPLRFDFKVLVYPKPSSIDVPIPDTGGTDDQQGYNQRGQDDFYGIQEYQAGDSIRHIHWKAYAKGQGLFSKQYTGEKSSEIWLDYQQTPGSNVEERLSFLCRWVVDAEQAHLNYGFKIPGTEYQPNSGQGHYQQCLEALALFEG